MNPGVPVFSGFTGLAHPLLKIQGNERPHRPHTDRSPSLLSRGLFPQAPVPPGALFLPYTRRLRATPTSTSAAPASFQAPKASPSSAHESTPLATGTRYW